MSTRFEEIDAKPNRRLRIVVLLLMVPIALIFFLLVQVISPSMGRVVDAVSGEPVSNIRLTLEMSRYEGESTRAELHDSDISGMSGWFFLDGSVRGRGIPFPTLRSYWLTVNEGDRASGQDEESAESQVLYNPMSNQIYSATSGWMPLPVGDGRYFPLTITSQRGGCDRIWRATCAYKPFWAGISVQLIPVLKNIDDCQKIGSPSVRENCRQLNTYRAAFVHVDTYDEVQRGKALCAEVDHASISSTCLEQLGVYVANPGGFARGFTPPANEPIPDGMFPDSIAGFPVMNNRHCGPRNLFYGLLDCSAGYGSFSKQAVVVYIRQWPEGSKKPAVFSHIGNPSRTTELRSGGSVLRYSSVQTRFGKPGMESTRNYVSYVWYSGNSLVEVLFYDPIKEQEQFLSYYLGRFPSTSQ